MVPRVLRPVRVLLLWLVAALPVAAQTESVQGASEIRPADVLQQVRAFDALTERLRWHMGRPRVELAPLVVLEAEPREVYFQAVNLHRKVGALTVELGGQVAALPPRNRDASLKPADVYGVVTASLELIRGRVDALGLESEAVIAEVPADAQPTDVYNALLIANGQLNRMLETPVSATDNYVRVMHARQLLDGLLSMAHLQPTTPGGEAAALGGRTPADAFHRISNCLRLTDQLMRASGISMLKFAIQDTGSVSAGDVDDLTALLFSELAHLYYLKHAVPPGPSETLVEGRYYPTDVVRVAITLEQDLAALIRYAKRAPQWLLR